MRILLTIPRASYVEGKLKRSIEDEGNSVLIGNMASKEGRMNNKTEFQLPLLESAGRFDS